MKTFAERRPFLAHVLAETFSRLTSRKLWMFIFSVSLCWLGLERGVNHLYSLPAASVNVYGGMFLCVMGAITAMACKFMGIDNVNVSATTSVTGAISAAAQALTEKRESHEVVETIEHVIHEGDPGAPDRPPFNPNLSHEDEQ